MEVDPYLQNQKVVDQYQSQGILVTGYILLAVGKVKDEEVLLGVANRHGVSGTEVVITWVPV